MGVRVSVFVWGTRDAEGVGRGRPRAGCRRSRGPPMLCRAPQVAHATGHAHAGRHPSGRAAASPIKPQVPLP